MQRDPISEKKSKETKRQNGENDNKEIIIQGQQVTLGKYLLTKHSLIQSREPVNGKRESMPLQGVL